MKYYFYCPRCKNEYEAGTLPRGTVGNIRDGYGVPIHHCECGKCHNLDAGFMALIPENDDDTKMYFRSIISMYQGIRGLKD